MRVLHLAAMSIVMAVPATSVQAQTPQVSPVRVEFTRPGGTPGSARAVVRPSEAYMIAPAQPEADTPVKRRKRR